VLCVPPEDIVPSPLHIIMGITNDCVTALEKIATEIDVRIKERLVEVLSRHGITRHAWMHNFTGEYCR
jgi:hypothetical protein